MCAKSQKRIAHFFGEKAKTIALQKLSNFEEIFVTKYKVYHV